MTLLLRQSLGARWTDEQISLRCLISRQIQEHLRLAEQTRRVCISKDERRRVLIGGYLVLEFIDVKSCRL